MPSVPRVSLRARHWANWAAVRTILPTWLEHLEQSFSYKEVQFKTFCILMNYKQANITLISISFLNGLKNSLSVEWFCEYITWFGNTPQQENRNTNQTNKSSARLNWKVISQAGLSIRAVTHDTCHGWVWQVCYGC